MNNTIRNDFPYPIAKVYLKTINAEEPIEKFTMIGYLFEIALKYASAISISEYLCGITRDDTINKILSGINRPSIGKWAEFLRETLKYNRNTGKSLFGDSYFKRNADFKKMVLAVNKMNEHLNPEKPQIISTLSPEFFTNTFVSYRNKTKGHGAIQKADCQKINDILLEGVEEYILSFEEFIKFTPAYISKIEVGKGEEFIFTLQKLNGTDMVRATFSTTEKIKSIGKGHICLCERTESGLKPILSLHPIFIFIEDKEEVYVLNESETSRMEYLCYHKGGKDAIYSPDELKEDFAEKFGDIVKMDSVKIKATEPTTYIPAAEHVKSEPEKKGFPFLAVVGTSVGFILILIAAYFLLIKGGGKTEPTQLAKIDSSSIVKTNPTPSQGQTTSPGNKPTDDEKKKAVEKAETGKQSTENTYIDNPDTPPIASGKPDDFIDYSNLKMAASFQGSVRVKAYINETGKVDKTDIVSGIDTRFDNAAANAVKQLKFTPAAKGGKKIKSIIIITVPFKGQK
jgi:TonB family protein